MLKKKGAKKLSDVNEVLGGIDYTKLKTKHITLIAQNLVGVKNLYKIVSDAHVNHFYRAPRILKSVLEKYSFMFIYKVNISRCHRYFTKFLSNFY